MADISRTHQQLKEAHSAFLDFKRAYERSEVSRNLEKVAEAMRGLESLQGQIQEDEKRKQEEIRKMQEEYEKKIKSLEEENKQLHHQLETIQRS